jgi:hypothetical protein
VVVEGHAGQVEGVGLCGIARELNDKRLDVLALERPADGYGIQFIDDVVLVLCEGGAKALLGEQSGDAVLDELVVPVQRGDRVQAAGEAGCLSGLSSLVVLSVGRPFDLHHRIGGSHTLAAEAAAWKAEAAGRLAKHRRTVMSCE